MHFILHTINSGIMVHTPVMRETRDRVPPTPSDSWHIWRHLGNETIKDATFWTRTYRVDSLRAWPVAVFRLTCSSILRYVMCDWINEYNSTISTQDAPVDSLRLGHTSMKCPVLDVFFSTNLQMKTFWKFFYLIFYYFNNIQHLYHKSINSILIIIV